MKVVITTALGKHRKLSFKIAGQELELAKQTVEEARQAKSDFLARISHEIRTPMNLIMGMNSFLLKSPLNEKQRREGPGW